MLIGTLSGSAAPITTAARNTVFQPRPTMNAAVLKPAQARILGGGQRAVLPGQKTIPLWRSPEVNKLSRGVFSQPDKAAGGG
jgi:hypothetical protein